MSQQESKNQSVVARMYADLERGDVEGVITTLSHDVARVVASGPPYGGTYTGHEAVGGVFSVYGDVWEGLAVIPDKIVAGGDLVTSSPGLGAGPPAPAHLRGGPRPDRRSRRGGQGLVLGRQGIEGRNTVTRRPASRPGTYCSRENT